jgi:hypothetical protein
MTSFRVVAVVGGALALAGVGYWLRIVS